MHCVCIDKATGDLFVQERSERDNMISVLIDLKQTIPSWVLRVKDTKEEADQLVKDILDANEMIEKTFKNNSIEKPNPNL